MRYLFTFLDQLISLCDTNPHLKSEFGLLADWWLITHDGQYLKNSGGQKFECSAALGWLKERPLLVETACRCQMSYRSVMLTSQRAMGNSAGPDRGQGEDCALIKKKKGNYARMLPEGADSVTPRLLRHVADRRLPFLTTATVCSTVHTLTACLCRVSADAVHHGRRRLLLYCSCAALRYFTRCFCLNGRDLIFFTGIFFFSPVHLLWPL